jgi:hypothetical protein
LETGTVTGVPIGVIPLRRAKVSVPPFTTPAGLVTVAVNGTLCAALEKGVEALDAVVVVGATPTVRLWEPSEDPARFGVGL